MGVDLGIMWFHPSELAVDLDTLLLVHHVVMDDAGNLQLVGTGTIRMENDFATAEEFVGHLLPILQADRARPRSSLGSELWRKTIQNQGLRLPSLMESAGRGGAADHIYIYIWV